MKENIKVDKSIGWKVENYLLVITKYQYIQIIFLEKKWISYFLFKDEPQTSIDICNSEIPPTRNQPTLDHWTMRIWRDIFTAICQLVMIGLTGQLGSHPQHFPKPVPFTKIHRATSQVKNLAKCYS